jgi:ornithine cyclodeaminase/alanine dehydrogenase-like protein (mu-crystallin family)
VTATRSTEPLFEAGALASDAFLAAVGATLPAARELPSAAFARAGRVVVEDAGQSFAEAGDLIAAIAAGDLLPESVETLADALVRPGPPVGGPTIFKSVGVALADVAVAGAVWRALEG